jgi:hypothetical protein
MVTVINRVFKMLVLVTAPLDPTLPLGFSPLTAIDQIMISRHTCPCCSHILLRHIRLGKLYWRCSHCYQPMPVWS